MSADRRYALQRKSPQSLLVTSPHVTGTPYDRTVVFLLEHTPRRSLGVVLDDDFQESVQRFGDSTPVNPRLAPAQTPESIGLPVDVVVWESGQLESEIAQGVWLRTSASFQDVVDYARDGDLWFDLLQKIGQAVLRDALHIEELPDDPWMN
jgi:putative AlgH/UPF0301 family transcriptional regulator